MFIKLQDVLTLALVNGLYVYAQSTGLNVTTAQGPVIGSLVSSNVRQFLGIPYASAQRWEAPTPPPSRVTPLNATNFGKSCPQALNTFNVQFYRTAGLDDSTIFVPESEDCLSVNIWTPSVSRKQSTAVLIWIYGGSFQFGSSSLSWYNGKHIVEDNDDITVVSLNYRLNIFNAPYAPQLISNTTAPQNFGLLDIDAAIQWVHRNIAVFGGDPNRITLFGQSAGAAAVDLYTFAHPSDTIVKGVIEQSGTVNVVETAFATLSPAGWNEVASLVGCGIVNDAHQLACMKQIPSKQIEDAVISTNAAFAPTPDGICLVALDTPSRSC
ncbi:hypothetical protein H0H93_006121 [Arthromyces matolae]|nr:hypothetical protein H0H93_006121 [Arthromyces matolae]